jgi:thiamine-phosphate pyrophosphorylase
MTEDVEPTRLFLVTPQLADADTLPSRLAEALSAGDVAAVLITAADSEEATEAIATKLVPLIQRAGAAALIGGYTRVAGRLRADGVHVGSGLGDLKTAIDSFRPRHIVGAGNLHSRHAAMEAGELGPDYLLFGHPHGDTHDAPHPKALELAEWWSELTDVPAVAMAGRSLESVAEAAATGAAFVGLHQAVWSHAGGPADAIRQAQATLRRRARETA